MATGKGTGATNIEDQREKEKLLSICQQTIALFRDVFGSFATDISSTDPTIAVLRDIVNEFEIGVDSVDNGCVSSGEAPIVRKRNKNKRQILFESDDESIEEKSYNSEPKPVQSSAKKTRKMKKQKQLSATVGSGSIENENKKSSGATIATTVVMATEESDDNKFVCGSPELDIDSRDGADSSHIQQNDNNNNNKLHNESIEEKMLITAEIMGKPKPQPGSAKKTNKMKRQKQLSATVASASIDNENKKSSGDTITTTVVMATEDSDDNKFVCGSPNLDINSRDGAGKLFKSIESYRVKYSI